MSMIELLLQTGRIEGLLVRSDPVAQPRARASRVRPGMMYEQTTKRDSTGRRVPLRHVVYKDDIRAAWGERLMFTGPVGLIIELVMRRPQDKIWKRRPMPSEWHEAKPDLDNVEKAIKDALIGYSWEDDRRVAHVTKMKRVASGDEQPHTKLVIFSLSPEMLVSEMREFAEATRHVST